MGGGKMYRYEREVVCVEVGVLWARDEEEAYAFVEEGEGLWPEGRTMCQPGRTVRVIPIEEEAESV